MVYGKKEVLGGLTIVRSVRGATSTCGKRVVYGKEEVLGGLTIVRGVGGATYYNL